MPRVETVWTSGVADILAERWEARRRTMSDFGEVSGFAERG